MDILRGLSFYLFLLFFFSTLSWPTKVLAGNGLKPIAPGPLEYGYGGAGVGLIQTAQTIFLNPAGMGKFGNELAVSLIVPIPRVKVDTSQATLGNPDAVDQISDQLGYIPNVGLIFRLPWENIRLGFGIITWGGTQISIDASRVNSSFTNNEYDKNVFFGNVKFIPSVSFKLSDQLYVGAGLDINFAALKTDVATNAPGFPETTGNDEFEDALGIGGRVGIWFRPLKKLDVGISYVFRSRMQAFEAYQDVLSTGLDLPRELAVGLGYRPFEGAQFGLDFRWINYSIGVLGRDPTEGGFGWQDQYVVATGFGYDFWPKFKIPVHVAAGYNYGRSPVKPSTLFPNLLVPATIEHHFSMALAFRIKHYLDLDIAYARLFPKTLVDNGSLNPGFAGATLESAANNISLGLRGRWGKGE